MTLKNLNFDWSLTRQLIFSQKLLARPFLTTKKAVFNQTFQELHIVKMFLQTLCLSSYKAMPKSVKRGLSLLLHIREEISTLTENGI